MDREQTEIEASIDQIRETDEYFATSERMEIAELAYRLWEQRGGKGGSPADDWITAKRMYQEQGRSGLA